MSLGFFKGFACGAVAVLALLATMEPAHALTEMVLSKNRSEMITLNEPVSEVVVSNPDVLDVIVHDTQRISLLGRGLGESNLQVLGERGQVLKSYNVQVTHDMPAIRKALLSLFPNERVGLEMVNDNIAITGVISDAATAKKVIEVVSEFVNETVSSPDEKSSVINLASLRSGQQVMLRVRIGEIQRNTLKQIGFNLNAVRNTGNFAIGFGSGPGGLIDPLLGGANNMTYGAQDGFAGASIFNTGLGSLGVALEALEEEGLLKILAEPNIVATSGEKAEFLAGGEFPYAEVDTNGGDRTVTVQFKPYGVSLQFVPFVLSENRLRLVVAPEVSEIDLSNTINEFPALTTRRVQTTVELAPGETFMIAGLIQDRLSTEVSETPGIAEIPILSSLFRRTLFDRNETELVIAVTPYLVDPVPNGDIKLPTDDFRPPSVLESLFYGALGSMGGEETRISQTPQIEGPIGFMVD